MSQLLAVVTGGSSGIGRAVAERFVKDGHRVLITGRRAAALAAAAEELGALGTVETAAFDVGDEAAVDAALRERDVDILVNNAGYANSAPLHKMALADFTEMLSVHAIGAFLCTRAVLGGMKQRDGGRIITVSSMAGVSGARYIAGYVAAKHASIGLMRATAAEVAGSRVTANAVCPAYVDTPMTDHSVASISGFTGQGEDKARQGLVDLTSLGRLVTPEEVAAAVAYFASPEAGAVNGQILLIDGGGIYT